MTTTNDYKLSIYVNCFRFSNLWPKCLLNFVHVFTFTNLLVVPNKKGLAVYYLRSLCLCAFATRRAAICLCRKVSAVRHPVDCILSPAFCLLPSDFCLLFSTGWSLIVRAKAHFVLFC